MKYGLGIDYKCRVCGQDAFPASSGNFPTYSASPDRYHTCIVCEKTVPYSVRRLKTYQKRWDEENVKMLWEKIHFLQKQIQQEKEDT